MYNLSREYNLSSPAIASPPSSCSMPACRWQVRLCLAKRDFIRAQILARKISPRAFQKQQGDSKGEIGIEGTAIEEADTVSCCGASALHG